MNGRHRFSGKRAIQVLNLNEYESCALFCNRFHNALLVFSTPVFGMSSILTIKTNPLSLMYSLERNIGGK